MLGLSPVRPHRIEMQLVIAASNDSEMTSNSKGSFKRIQKGSTNNFIKYFPKR